MKKFHLYNMLIKFEEVTKRSLVILRGDQQLLNRDLALKFLERNNY